MQEKIEIGVIGAGDIAAKAHIPLLLCLDKVRVKYVADIQDSKGTFPASIQKIKIKGDLSILPHCDVVLVATPVGAREKYIKEFSKRKIPIFSEKPFAIDTSTHKEFLALTNKVTCNYMRNYYSSIQQVKDIIKTGIFGKLKEIRVADGGIIGKTQLGKEHHQTKASLAGGGALMVSGCHSLSQITYLLSNYTFAVQKANIMAQNGLDVDGEADIFAKRKHNTCKINYKISLIRPLENISRYFFENAEIRLQHNNPAAVLQILPLKGEKTMPALTINQDKRYATTFYQAFYLKWKDFLDKITQQKVLDTAEETSIETTKLITDMYKEGMKN